MNTAEFVQHHGAQAEQTARSFIDPNRPVAHVWFEESLNFGDAGIWCGQLDLFERVGVEIRYTCSNRDFDAAAMRRAIGDDGTIVLRGGGNFGDLYVYHKIRLEILKEFPANPIVQLPQTAQFKRGGLLEPTRDALGACGDVTLLARDAMSCALFLEHFESERVRVLTCPDIAFASGSRARPLEPTFDVVAVLRTDGESRYHRKDGPIFGEVPRQRLAIAREGSIRISGNAPGDDVIVAEIGIVSNDEGSLFATDWYLTRIVEGKSAYDALPYGARARLGRDIADRLLSRGRVVITDRLHAHIFALQLGIPHVIVDNNYGKLASYFRTWTRHCDLVRFADTLDDALTAARELLEAAPSAGNG